MKTILLTIIGIITSVALNATNVDTTETVHNFAKNTVLFSSPNTDLICELESDIMSKEEMLTTFDNLYFSDPTNADYLIQRAILEMEIEELQNQISSISKK